MITVRVRHRPGMTMLAAANTAQQAAEAAYRRPARITFYGQRTVPGIMTLWIFHAEPERKEPHP